MGQLAGIRMVRMIRMISGRFVSWQRLKTIFLGHKRLEQNQKCARHAIKIYYDISVTISPPHRHAI